MTGGTKVAVDALATFRLTRFLQQDTLPPLPALRTAYTKRLGATPWGDLVDCPWCLSAWCYALLEVGHRFAPNLTNIISRGLAASAVAGLLSEWVDTLHDE